MKSQLMNNKFQQSKKLPDFRFQETSSSLENENKAAVTSWHNKVSEQVSYVFQDKI